MKNKEEVRIISCTQARAYIKNGAKLLRVEADSSLIFVFDKSTTEELYKLWKERKLIF